MKKEVNKKPCEMTLSGKHLFMPLYYETIIEDSENFYEYMAWVKNGLKNPKKCIACGMIDDVTHSEDKE